MNVQDNSREELINELQNLQMMYDTLKELHSKSLTECRQAETKLIRSESELKKAQQITHIGSWYLDVSTNRVEWTEELYKIFGFDPALPPPPFTDHQKLFTPESWELLSASVANTTATGIPYELELKTVKDDGTNGWMWVRGETVKDNAGNIIGLWGAAQDITDRKHTENELRMSEERNKLLSSVTMEGILIHRNGLARDLNQSLAKMLGYEYEELLNKDFFDIIHSDDHSLVHENIIKENALPYVVRAIRKDGEIINIEVESKNFEYKDEKWRVSAIRDITAKKQSEELLRTMVEMLNIAPGSITVHDNEGRFLYANQKTFELHGYTESEFMSINLHVLDVPESEAMLSERLRLIEESGNKSFEVAHYHKDGHEIPLEVFAKKVEWRGQPAVLSIATDITERKLAKEEIIKARVQAEKSEARFRNYIQSSPTAVFLIDKHGKYTFANNSACNLLGYSEEEMLQLSIINLLNPNDIKNETKTFRELKQTGELRNVEKKLFKKDGKTIDIILDGKKLSENEYIAFVKDITIRKNAEKALLESEEKYRVLFNTFPLGITISDSSGNILESNARASELLDLSKDEHEARRIDGEQWRIIHPDGTPMPPEEYASMKALKENRLIENIEMGIVKPNEEIIWLNVTAAPLLLEKYGVAIAYSDITEKKQAEKALRDSEERFRTANNASLDSLLLLHSERDETGAICDFIFQDINSRAIEMLYMGRDQLIGRRLCETLPINRESGFFEKYKQVVETGIPLQEEFFLPETHVPACWYFHQVVKVDDGIFICHRDISENKKAEEELIKAKEKAEESDRLKSAFLANMSHEIRTPMNGILGFTELLKEPHLTYEEQQDFIHTIQISGERMLNTINSIVDISKIESGLISVDIKEADLNEKIEFIYKFFKPEIEKKGLEFLYKNGLPSNEAVVKTDNEKVSGILTNLIKNALKFTYEGSIEFGYVLKSDSSVVEISRNAELEFFVKDTGVGIPASQRDLIFERFRQGSESNNRGYEGSGLGLSISRSYAEMLGGRIWLESREGQGTTFYFTIPYNPVSAEKFTIENVDFADNKEVQITKLKILIVEDDGISCSLLKRVLQKISTEVVHAVTGVEAVEACRNNPDIDLVLMDIRMPEWNGLEATKQIRQFNKNVIIIAQTAFGFSSDREMALEAGCNDYISKPINKDKLFEIIKKHSGKFTRVIR